MADFAYHDARSNPAIRKAELDFLVSSKTDLHVRAWYLHHLLDMVATGTMGRPLDRSQIDRILSPRKIAKSVSDTPDPRLHDVREFLVENVEALSEELSKQ